MFIKEALTLGFCPGDSGSESPSTADVIAQKRAEFEKKMRGKGKLTKPRYVAGITGKLVDTVLTIVDRCIYH